jgi:mRNA interferase MazF
LVALMRRGEVWLGNLNPTRGREIGKIRPVLIVQENALDESITPLVVCLPLTTQIYPGLSRWRVTVPARDRLLHPSQIVTDQPRTLDRSRIGDGPLTTLTAAEMHAVEEGLRALLGLV